MFNTISKTLVNFTNAEQANHISAIFVLPIWGFLYIYLNVNNDKPEHILA